MKYESRDVILDVVTTYDFMLTNTWLKKMDSHLITFKALQTLVEQISSLPKKSIIDVVKIVR